MRPPRFGGSDFALQTAESIDEGHRFFAKWPHLDQLESFHYCNAISKSEGVPYERSNGRNAVGRSSRGSHGHQS